MENTYGEFEGTELDPALDFDFDDDEMNDLVPILGLAAVVAAIVGGILMLFGRRKQPTTAERAQDMFAQASKDGKKSLRAATKAVEDAKLRDLLDEALDRARKAGADVDLQDLLKEARKKASKATEDLDLQELLKDAQKKAKKAARDIDMGEVAGGAREAAVAAAAGLTPLLQDAIGKARDASSRIDMSDLPDTARKARKRAAEAVSDVQERAGHLNGEATGHLLEEFKDKLLELVETVRTEVAPKAAETLRETVIPAAQEAAHTVAHTVREDVVPTAQDAVEKLREDVLPAAQERAGKLAEEYEVVPRARKAAAAATEGAGNVSNMLRTLAMAVIDKMVSDVLPEAKKTGGKAMRVAREDVIPTAAETAGEAARKVRKDVLPKVSEAASQTPGMLSDLLEMAREKAGEAMDRAQPVVSDAAKAARHKAADIADGGKGGVTGAVSSARHGVTGAVGGAVDATTHAARETAGILFWLSMLSGLVLLAFVPEREKQEELWNNVRQFLGEVREMWRDLQGPEYEMDTEGETPA